MRVLRTIILGASVCVVLVGCGTSRANRSPRTTRTVTAIGPIAISQLQVQQYVNYALHFYSWADTTASSAQYTTCAEHTTAPACATLRKQVLRRLLEERIVHDYATRHGIRLSATDSSRVNQELLRLRAPRAGTRRLFSAEHVSPQFMRGVLENQLLVKRVETAVARTSALSGPSFRLRKYVFGSDRQSYRAALDLTTGGSTGTPGHTARVRWVAGFRLPTRVRALLSLAGKGDFVGPSEQGASYVVYQMLGRGTHRFGLPARQAIEARVFRTWMAQQISQRQMSCMQATDRAATCAALFH